MWVMSMRMMCGEKEMAWALLVFALWVWVIRVVSLLLHKTTSLFLILLFIDRVKRKKKEEQVGFMEGAKRKDEEEAVSIDKGSNKKEAVGFVESAKRKNEEKAMGFDKKEPMGFVEGAKRKKEEEPVGFDKKEPVFGTSSSAIGLRQVIWILIGIYLCFF